MALIQTRKLTKAYKNGETTLIALNEIDLEIACGEIVAITGPSGSGKTTLMHLLGCLDKPTSGQFFLEGQDISDMTSNQLAYVRNQKIGFVFQNFHLLNDLDAIENVVLPQLYGGVSEKMARKKRVTCWRESGWAGGCFTTPISFRGAKGSGWPLQGR